MLTVFGCGRKPTEDSTNIQVVDDYLLKWDQFACGDNDLGPYLNENYPSFEASLTRLINTRDRRAASRLVFYVVVQVGGSIGVDTALGKAAIELVGPDFPIHSSEEDGDVLFAPNLYDWWVKSRGQYESFSLFDEWSKREFAQTTVIPMYQSLNKQ